MHGATAAGCAEANLASSRPAMTAPPAPIATPCVKVCIVDGESGLCLGCYRTLGEVARWSASVEVERQRIMAELPERRQRIRPEKLGLVG
jgi:hypothetical protein